jgi:transposase
MERRKFTREFKLEAVRLIKDRGVSYVQASQDLGVRTSQWLLREGVDVKFGFIAKPRGSGRRVVVRRARCLARWLLCLADTTAQSAQPQ